ncbi:MAG: nucleotide-binding protein [Promethearchaeota archaeon]
MSKTSKVISIVGKGGVGKTMITTLLAKTISEKYNYKLLLIDADPTHPHLSNMVKLKPKKSIEEIRLEAIKNVFKKDSQNLAENIDFHVYEGIAENKNFCLFSIGQPVGPGCFCPSNTLLRKVLESISKDFDIVLIDCEAGLEQINRKVIKSVDVLLIIVDISLRSIETADSIRKSAKRFTNYKKLGVIINRAKPNIDKILKRIEELGLPLLAQIPEDEIITEFDLEGKALIDIPENTPCLLALGGVVKEILTNFS